VTVSQGPRRPISPPAPQAIRRPVNGQSATTSRLPALRREHWLAAGALAALLCIVALAARGGGGEESAPAMLMSTALELPATPLATNAADATQNDDDAQWTVVRVAPGQTMGAIFAELGLSAATLHRLLQQPSLKTVLTRIRPGHEFAFAIDDGKLTALRFDREDHERVVVRFDGEALEEDVQARAIQRRVHIASGVIEDSLIGAGEKAGMSYTAILELAKAFGYDIDFSQDLRVGDRFDVVYEEIWRDGERLRSGDVLAATFVNQNKRYQVFRYQFADGRTDYFDAEGRPMKKGFLRMPIDFARISSRFSTARKHPVLGKVRAHKGVDYAARTGTPIMAAGEGRVKFAGWQNGYGRTVIIDHGNNVTTLYGHMSQYGRFKTGARVRQGDVIGQVGASGLATGPHLHYEFRVAGVHRDPLTVTLPKPQPLPKNELDRFRLQTQPLLAQLEVLSGGRHYASR